MPSHGAQAIIPALVILAGCLGPSTSPEGRGSGEPEAPDQPPLPLEYEWHLWHQENGTAANASQPATFRIWIAQVGDDAWILRQEPGGYTWWVNRTPLHHHSASVPCAASVRTPTPTVGAAYKTRCDEGAVSGLEFNAPPWDTTIDVSRPELWPWRQTGEPAWAFLEFKVEFGKNEGGTQDASVLVCRQAASDGGDPWWVGGRCTGIRWADFPQRTAYFSEALYGNFGPWQTPGSYRVWIEPENNTLLRDAVFTVEVAGFCCSTYLPSNLVTPDPVEFEKPW